MPPAATFPHPTIAPNPGTANPHKTWTGSDDGFFHDRRWRSFRDHYFVLDYGWSRMSVHYPLAHNTASEQQRSDR